MYMYACMYACMYVCIYFLIQNPHWASLLIKQERPLTVLLNLSLSNN